MLQNFVKKTVSLAVMAVLCASCGGISSQAKKMYQEAVASWEQGDQDQAIGKLRAATEDSPQYFDAYMTLGDYHLARKEHSESAQAYEKATGIRPFSADARLRAGEGYLAVAKQNGDYLKAQYHFSEALKIPSETGEPLVDMDEFRANLGKGICLLQQTLTRDARPYLDKAMELDQKLAINSLDCIFYRAVLKEAEMGGANTTSIEMYQQVLEKQPDHLESLKHMGVAYQSLDYKQKAVGFYQKYLEAGGIGEAIAKFVADNKPEESKPEETVMVCPDCGRIGRKGDTHCMLCGIPLVEEKH